MMKILFTSLIIYLVCTQALAEQGRFLKSSRLLQEQTPPANTPDQNQGNGQRNSNSSSIKIVGRSVGQVKLDRAVVGITLETVDRLEQGNSTLTNSTETNPAPADQPLANNNTSNVTSTIFESHNQTVITFIEQLKALGVNESDISPAVNMVIPYHKEDFRSFLGDDDDDDNNNVQPQQPDTNSTEQDENLHRFRTSLVISSNNTEAFGQMIETALDNGFDFVDFVYFQADEDDLETLSDKLMSGALDNAKKMAQVSADKLGYQLGAILKIHVDDATAVDYDNDDDNDDKGLDFDKWENKQISTYKQQVEVTYELLKSQ